VDEALLRDIPLQEKQGMRNAKAEMDRAAEERDLAVAGLATAKQDVDFGRATRSQAKLEVGKDRARLDLAEKRKDADTIRDANERIRVSELAVAGADARIDWLAQQQKVRQAEVALAEAHQRVASARYELEKARLAQQENRRPSEDFRVSQFEQQVADQKRQQQAAAGELESERAQAARLRDAYTQLAQQYNQQRTRVPGSDEPALILPLPQETLRAKVPSTSPM